MDKLLTRIASPAPAPASGSAIAAVVAERKGYGERLGLAFGLLLSAVGLVIVLLIPARPGSRWKEEGIFGGISSGGNMAAAGVKHQRFTNSHRHLMKAAMRSSRAVRFRDPEVL